MSVIKVNKIEHTGTTAGGVEVDSSGHVTVDGQQMPTVGALSNRNCVINGGAAVSQRGAIDVTSGGDTTFTAVDRFGLLNYWGSGQVGTTQSTEAPPNFLNSLKLEVDTAPPMSGSTGYSCNLCQTIEGYNIRHAYTGNITLTFWVRSSVTGTYSVTFSNSSTAIELGDRVYVAEYTINTANTWEKKTITVDLSVGRASGTWNTVNEAGLGIHWNLGGESNRKGDTHLNSWGTLASANIDIMSADQVNWISTASATFYLTGVQLEAGEKATPFEHRSYGDELARCQRYFVALHDPPLRGVFGTTTVVNRCVTSLPTTMRKKPTYTTTGTYDIYDGASIGTVTTFSASYTTTNSVEFDATVASGTYTAGNPACFYVHTSTNQLNVDAEL